MNVFQSTEEFDDWLGNLKDCVAKARIFNRIDAATLGNFGECEPVGEGVSEMKIHVGGRIPGLLHKDRYSCLPSVRKAPSFRTGMDSTTAQAVWSLGRATPIE